MLETERRGRVLVVRIDHPPHNFMTAEMVRELQRVVHSLRDDRSVGAVVITGKPDDLYVTHYDVGEILRSVQRAGIAAPPWLTAIVLRVVGAVRRVPILRDLAERTPMAAVFELYRIHDLFLEMNRSDKVFIAAINGPATGGGCELSLACDVRLMADKDIAIGLPGDDGRLQPWRRRDAAAAAAGRRRPGVADDARGADPEPARGARSRPGRRRRAAGPGQGGGDPHGRAPVAARTGSDPVAEARRL